MQFLEKKRPPPASTERGRQAEDHAWAYLQAQGLRLLQRNYRTPGRGGGEIDLICQTPDGTVVFVEVKTRRSNDAGAPVDAVDSAKQRRLVRLALAWLKRRGMLNHAARFDILALTWPRGARRPEIVHYRNAFEPTGRGQMFC